MKRIILAVLGVWVAGCPAKTVKTTDQTPTPPTAITYSDAPFVFTVGKMIDSEAPGYEGGKPTSYTVTPDLPRGLSFAETTGIISGTPSEVTAKATYTVTGTNDAGSAMGSIDITVSAAPVAPSGLAYSNPAPMYPIGSAIITNHATLAVGAPATFTVAPALPAGLSLSATSGDITGTPTGTAMSAMTFVVTATNAAGHATASLTISIVDPSTVVPPDMTGYNPAIPAQLDVGFHYSFSPVVVGFDATGYAFSPSTPPPGFTFDTTTGIIAGTGTSVFGPSGFTVTASNAKGNDTTPVTITLQLVQPVQPTVVWPSGPVTYCQPGTAIASFPAIVTPTGSLTFSSGDFSPALPAGLTVDANGTISGAPQGAGSVGPFTYMKQVGPFTVTGLADITFHDPSGVGAVISITANSDHFDGPTLGSGNPTIASGQSVTWSITGGSSLNWFTDIQLNGRDSGALAADEDYTQCFNGAGSYSWSVHSMGVDHATTSGVGSGNITAN